MSDETVCQRDGTCDCLPDRLPIVNRSGYEISALGDAVRQALPDYGRVTISALPSGDGYSVEVRR